jgi:hypothetical protein
MTEHQPTVLDEAKRLQLAPNTRRPLEQELIAKRWSEVNLELLEMTKSSTMIPLAIVAAPVYSLILALFLSLVGCATDRGPMFGLDADLICSTVCETCTGPYTIQSWSTTSNGSTSNHHVVLCQSPTISAEAWTFSERIDAKKEHHPQVLPGGRRTLGVVTYMLALPLGFGFSLIRQFQRRAGSGTNVAKLRRELEQLEAQLDGPTPDSAEGRKWLLAWLLFAYLLPVLIAVVNLGIR